MMSLQHQEGAKLVVMPPPSEGRSRPERVPLGIECMVDARGRRRRMSIENASANGLLLVWESSLYHVLKVGDPLAVYCNIRGEAVRAEGAITRIEYRKFSMRIAVRDVAWFQ